MAVMLTDRAYGVQRCPYRCCDATSSYTKRGKAVLVRRTRRREGREWRSAFRRGEA